MKKPRNLFWILLCLCISPMIALAQEDCPAIVQAALTATDQVCSITGRNQACYGNINLLAVPQEGATLNFSKPGDLVDVNNVQSFKLSPLDLAGKAWGVALMKLQANIPDTLPGQNVTFLLFGNVEIENATEQVSGTTAPPQPPQTSTVTLPATVTTMAPVMESLTDTTKIPNMLNGGTQVTADGRDATGQMIHIQLADGTSGWTVAQMLTVQGDVNTLPELDLIAMPSVPDVVDTAPTMSEIPQSTPMQAFYFKTGVNDAPCAQAPDSGILIQTPEGVGRITLTMNGVEVQLGSTAYVQAAAGQNDQTELTVNVVEGQGIVSAEGETRLVPAGSRVRVPLQEVDNHLVEAGVPGEVEPYDASALVALPVGHLERDISIAPALTTDQLAALLTSVNPVAGIWHYTPGAPDLGGGCPPEMQTALTTSVTASTTNVTMSGGPFSFQEMYISGGGEMPAGSTFGNPEPNLYTMDSSFEGGTMHWSVRIVSPTLIQGQWDMAIEGCTFSTPFELVPVGS